MILVNTKAGDYPGAIFPNCDQTVDKGIGNLGEHNIPGRVVPSQQRRPLSSRHRGHDCS